MSTTRSTPIGANIKNPASIPLNRLQAKAQRRGIYIAEFLGQSVISDEVGVMLNDGPGWCLGIFLDRKKRSFSQKEISRLEAGFAVFAAIHDLDTRSRSSNFMRTSQPSSLGREPLVQNATLLPADLWPELSARERELVKLILAGHPTASIAQETRHRRRHREKPPASYLQETRHHNGA